jgi:cobalt-zinc-cadmium efflux system protein
VAHAQEQHGHAHPHGDSIGNLRLAFFLNLAFTIIEFVGGVWTESMAVISDAFHDLGDVLVLGTAWYLSIVALRGRDAEYTYGYGRFAMLGGWITALVLIIGSCVLLVFTALRLRDPGEPHTGGMLVLAVFGLAMNGFAAWRLHGGGSLNERGAYLHLMEDVLGWLAVLIGAVIMHFTGWTFIDPLLAMAIAAFVLFNALRTLRRGTRILMQRLPEGFDEGKVTRVLRELPHVTGVHDQHAWSLDGAYVVLTVHLLLDTDEPSIQRDVKAAARAALTACGVHHATIELEQAGEPCSLIHH